MAKKKILLFIVEGQTDSYALDNVLSNFFNAQYKTLFHEIAGDILTKFYREKTAKQSINEAVNDFLDRNNYINKDVLYKVVHLIDTDGCFAPDSCIKFNSIYTKEIGCFYSDTEIQTDNVEEKKNRNEKKRNSINALTTLQKKVVLKTIPYEIYYFSCNRDHALHGNHNPTRLDKNRYAFEFRKQYENDFLGFSTFIKSLFPKNIQFNFDESWDYVKNDFHSLERGTNFILFLNQYLEKI